MTSKSEELLFEVSDKIMSELDFSFNNLGSDFHLML